MIQDDMNTPGHFFRQAANCARCGTFVKGVDTIKNKQQSTLALPLTKVSQRAYLWLGGEMVLRIDWFGLKCSQNLKANYSEPCSQLASL
ncbi:hypothetical protein D3C83_80660 [compost metagenome]